MSCVQQSSPIDFIEVPVKCKRALTSSNVNHMKPVAPSDQMRASGSGRRKVALPPGRSQLDWVRNSARLPRVRTRIVPMRDVRAHNSVDSAWLVVNGKVYDVTPYIEYHPGGVDMILAGAGKVCYVFCLCFIRLIVCCY